MDPTPSVTIADPWSIAQNIVLIFTGLITTGLAIAGYVQWNRQTRGTDRYSAGKKVISALSDFRDAMEALRSPFISNGEMQFWDGEERMKEKNPTITGEPIAYLRRMNEMRSARRALYIAVKECEVFQGIGFIEELDRLTKIFASVITAVQMHAERDGAGHYRREMTDEDRKFAQEQHALVYSMLSREDPTASNMMSAIKDLESKVRASCGV